jgi:DNA-directed RNA polymerase subunit omega
MADSFADERKRRSIGNFRLRFRFGWPTTVSRHFLGKIVVSVSVFGPESLTTTPFYRSFLHMKTDLIEKAAKVITDYPLLINLVSRRVRQLNQGRTPLIQASNYGTKLGQGDIALLEIIEGRITAEAIPEGE